MTKVGSVISLFYSPVSGRIVTTHLDLDTQGIVGDKHYDKSIERSVLIASLDSYGLARDHGIDADYGVLGENLLIDYNPYHLPAKAKLQIGSVSLEITQHCTLCKSLSKVDSKLPKLLKNDRGIFAKVIVPGSIQNGDTVYLLD